MSEIVKRIAGTFIEDTPSSLLTPVVAWMQQELRAGRLRECVDQFAKQQTEMLDASLLLVDEVRPDVVVCRLPCRLCDHESPGTFKSEVVFTLNPVTGVCIRLR